MTQNLELAVHTFPGERPVLLIHGLTRSARLDWIEPGWPPALAAQGRGTIAVDLPGHGSCPRADPGAVSVNAIIAAMVAAIDSTGQELADVIGYSLGARLAWTLAATGRVRHLVLGGLSPADPIAGVDSELVGAVARGDAEAPDPMIEGLATWVSLPWLDLDQTLLLLKALSAEPFDPSVDIPSTPALVVAGSKDDRSDDLAATLPDATYLTVPGDHFGALMSPEFRAAAIGFLG
ncbi:MAG TPA: alpha/beta fold hydrolase [Streptosporangiaceae bacterium]|jgi:pimeloyl-ACP methyl ester carboxylesterase|nr:alpha/beta fold hydrolase [Streptosporangiaceae bacterium]